MSKSNALKRTSCPATSNITTGPPLRPNDVGTIVPR